MRDTILKKIAKDLKHLAPTWEYPGYLSIEIDGIRFDFGTANDCFGFDVYVNATNRDLSGSWHDVPGELPLDSDYVDVLEWVKTVITT